MTKQGVSRKLAATLLVSALLLSVAPVASHAEEGQSIPPAAIEKGADAPGCPNAEVGRPCCGSASCRESKAAAVAAGKPAGCPCQRARLAREAAKAAAEAK